MGADKYYRLNKDYPLQDISKSGSIIIEAAAQKLEEYGLKVRIGG